MRLAPSSIFLTLLAGLAATAALVIGACVNPDTVQGSCTPNVDGTGILQNADGCDQFAYCDSDGGPADCCKADGGAPLTGGDLAACLHGYGDPTCPYLTGGSGNFMCSTTPPVPDGGGAGGGGTTDGG